MKFILPHVKTGKSFILGMVYKNKYDQTGESSNMGSSAEQQFKQIAEKLSNKVIDASLEEQFNHIDFHIVNKFKRSCTVDVKARKKIKRENNNVEDDVVWIEFKNVQGKNGWIYGSATLIAFEQEHSFLIVGRKALANLCEKIINLDKIDTNNRYPLYTGYQRYNRKDLLSLIKVQDITNNLKYIIWKK